MSARVGIGVPVFNPDPAHLRAALDSIRAQSFRDFRVVVRDDGSRADVRPIVEPYLADPRFSLAPGRDHRGGIGASWNACVAELREPLVQLLFQDDAWAPGYLERSVAALDAHPAAAFSAAEHRYVDPSGAEAGGDHAAIRAFRRAHLEAGEHDGSAFLRWWAARGLAPNAIGEPSFVLLRRAALERAGPFAEDIPNLLDAEYWSRLLAAPGARFCWIADDLGAFRLHAGAAFATHLRAGRGVFDAFKVFRRLLAALPPAERPALAACWDRFLEQVLVRLADALAHRRPLEPGDPGAARELFAFAMRRPLGTARGLARYLAGAAARRTGRRESTTDPKDV